MVSRPAGRKKGRETGPFFYLQYSLKIMKIIQNYLDKNYFQELKTFILSNNFPFYYSDLVANSSDEKKLTDFHFGHMLFELMPNSEHFPRFKPLLVKLDVKALMRMKVNLYTRTEKIIKHNMHVDYNFEHKGAILSLNNCDGGTWIEDQFIESRENQMVLFDSSKPHCSTSCTNNQIRVNINLNYF
jgi:hypothetical protein|tara:strand:+ start:3038 stop:3595 length:558 start_codon:yes stop_codon:yes gene_type:complete